MASATSGGASVITLQFALKLSLDIAEQQVQAAINAAASFLPNDLPAPPVYAKINPADDDGGPVASRHGDQADAGKLRDFLGDAAVGDILDLRDLQGFRHHRERQHRRVRANPTALASYGLSRP